MVTATVAAVPLHMVDPDPIDAVGSGLTVIVTELDFEHPAALVSVMEYVVVVVGLTEAVEAVELYPEGELVQVYVLPLTEALPIVAELPRPIDASLPAFAAGSALTVIVVEFEFWHPVAVTLSVTVYVVVEDGLTVLLDAVELKPDGELTHE